MLKDYRVIAVDFDGTLFETEYPTILRPILPVIELAKERREAGDKLILWTCREGAELDAAVEACREFGLEFDAVNDNLPERKAEWGNNPRKVGADEYWDDRNGLMRGKGENDISANNNQNDLSWMMPADGRYDDLALPDMPLYAALWVAEHGGLLNCEVMFGYIKPRLGHLGDNDLRWMMKELTDIVWDLNEQDDPTGENGLVIKAVEGLRDSIWEELEGGMKR